MIRAGAVALALVMLLAGCIPARETLSAGHMDLGPVLVDGRWEIRITDDSGPRDPADVVLVVGDAAKGVVPESGDYAFLGAPGEPVWLIPQTQVPGVLWLGWSTEPAVTLSLRDVEGPGRMTVYFDYGGFRKPRIIGDDATLEVPARTHAHANWAFSAAGDYRATFTATLTSGATATATLRFAVG